MMKLLVISTTVVVYTLLAVAWICYANLALA